MYKRVLLKQKALKRMAEMESSGKGTMGGRKSTGKQRLGASPRATRQPHAKVQQGKMQGHVQLSRNN